MDQDLSVGERQKLMHLTDNKYTVEFLVQEYESNCEELSKTPHHVKRMRCKCDWERPRPEMRTDVLVNMRVPNVCMSF
jgi:hypothetical protein